jgi:3-dehydroquinate synthase II
MKFFWVEALGNTWGKRKETITASLESGAKGVLVKPEDVNKALTLGSIDIIAEFKKGLKDVTVLVGKNSDGQAPTIPDVEKCNDLLLIKKLKDEGYSTCGYVEIRSKAHERLAALEAKEADFIVVVGKDWKVIPLENLIAELQKYECKVIAGVKNAQEAKLALETLEVGVDGILLQSNDINEIKKTSELIEKSFARLELRVAKIKSLKPLSMGDRVCIDTASILNVGEGMLIGSQAGGLFLVHSESLDTEYTVSRPFRVNAGAVHAYVLGPDKKTRYLSELKCGDEVLAVDKDGNTRPVLVGRVKIEKRPLILVEAESEGKTYKTLLQNAETIMLLNEKGEPVSISKLKKGDGVLIYKKEIGRHFGMEIEESLIEK